MRLSVCASSTPGRTARVKRSSGWSLESKRGILTFAILAEFYLQELKTFEGTSHIPSHARSPQNQKLYLNANWRTRGPFSALITCSAPNPALGMR